MIANSRTFSQENSELLEILDGYLVELERGNDPDIEELVAKHPELAKQLREYAASLRFLQTAACDLDEPTDSEAVDLPEQTERRLGDFQIIDELGRGGMGIVYRAQQHSLNRQVALKVLPFAAVLDERQIARFHREAQAAAQLHHPNIVPVYSVGCERAVHFYSMQLINGQSLDTFLADLQNELGIGDRDAISQTIPYGESPLATPADNVNVDPPQKDSATIDRFSTNGSIQRKSYVENIVQLAIQAADALQHAHDYGVIHRDIKPSNLMIDERAKLWVTDFGLAHVQTSTELTLSGQPLGTLRYMSPEQAAGTMVVDQRTDIYSLGVTLYELLSLRCAVAGENRQQIFAHIENSEPKPIRRLNPAVPIDLETIILKATNKSRDQRYTTAAEFRDDLQRFLDGLPTLARRPSVVDRTTKWALRHRTFVFACLLVMLFTLVGTSVASLLIVREQAKTKLAHEEAIANYQAADRFFKQAAEAVDSLGIQMVTDLNQFAGTEPLQRALLLKALRYYEDFVQFAAEDLALRMSLAKTHVKIGRINQQLGNWKAAENAYRRALPVFDKLLNPENSSDVRSRMAVVRNNLGLIQFRLGQIDNSEASYKKAIAIQLELVNDDGDKRHLKDLANSLGNLGTMYGDTNRVEDAEKFLYRSMGILKKLLVESPQDFEFKKHLAICLHNLSFLQRDSNFELAEENCNNAIQIQRELLEQKPNSTKVKSDLAIGYNNLGTLQSESNNLDAAARSYHEAVKFGLELVAQSPDVASMKRELAISLNNLGRCLEKEGKGESAFEQFSRASRILEGLIVRSPNDPGLRASLGGVLNNLAIISQSQNDIAAAEKYYDDAIEHLQAATTTAPGIAEFKEFLNQAHENRQSLIDNANNKTDFPEIHSTKVDGD